MDQVTSFLINSHWFGLSVFVLAAVLVALTCHGFLWRVVGRNTASNSRPFCGVMIARLGTVHALILALLFTQEMADYRAIGRVTAHWVDAVADVYHSLDSYDPERRESAALAKQAVVGYANAMLRERASLAEARLSDETWATYHRISRTLRALGPNSEHQRYLYDQMLKDWDSISGYLSEIEVAVGYRMPRFFWILVIAGFFATVVPACVHPPTFPNLLALSVFAAYNGLAMYSILAIENPYTGPDAIHSVALEHLVETIGQTAQ